MPTPMPVLIFIRDTLQIGPQLQLPLFTSTQIAGQPGQNGNDLEFYTVYEI